MSRIVASRTNVAFRAVGFASDADFRSLPEGSRRVAGEAGWTGVGWGNGDGWACVSRGDPGKRR